MSEVKSTGEPRFASIEATATGYNLPPHFFCTNCNNGIEASEDKVRDYFLDSPIICRSCDAVVNWWEVVLRALRDEPPFFFTFAAIGANSTAFEIEIEPDTELTVRFSDYEIPENARILVVGYTPQGGGLFPVEVHGNHPLRHVVPNTVTLFPRPFPPGTVPSRTKVMAMVTWVEAPDEELWQQLVNAFEAYANNKLSDALIPANVAVEAQLFKLVTGFLTEVASNEHVESFLNDAATYGHQLNVLLAVIVRHRDLPRFPDHIRGQLNRLRRLRNDLAHRGRSGNTLQKHEVAEMLCAALFAFSYLRMVDDLIQAQVESSRGT